MPFFGDLAKMLSKQGPVSWEAAGQLALSIASGGQSEPNVDPMERITLEQLARVAELQVAAASGLTPSVSGRGVTILPVTRSQWVQHSLDAYRPLFEHLGMVTCRTYETPAAGTIPVFVLDRDYVRSVFGEAALELTLPADRPEDKIADVLASTELTVEKRLAYVDEDA